MSVVHRVGHGGRHLAVLILPSPPLATDLVDRLGPDRAARVGAWLTARGHAWAQTALDGAELTVAADAEGLDPAGYLAPVLNNLSDGDRWVDGLHGVVAVIPELAGWRPQLIDEALSDLDGGCPVAVGRDYDGGSYLLALARPLPQILGQLIGGWGSRGRLNDVFAALERERIEIGLLRPERALRRVRDAQAVVADPMADDELRALLR